MYIIYKHTNTITGKAYIGLTKHTIEKRWKQHVICAAKAARLKLSTHKFYNAINKYGPDVWVSEILETNVSMTTVETKEMYYISKYDTFHTGYNSTKGGLAFNGYIPPKGEDHSLTNVKEYTFYRRTGPAITCKISTLCTQFGLKRASVRSLITRRQAMLFGWAMSPIHLYGTPSKHSVPSIEVKLPFKRKIKAILPAKIRKPIVKDTCKCGESKSITASLCLKCYHATLKGKGNPIYGTTRPNSVKLAVSKRMRESADQTLRTWTHTMHGIEKDITTIGLRDKYPELYISHLKKITDGLPRYKSHKGWTLYVEKNT